MITTVVLVLSVVQSVFACPFCGDTAPSFSEQIASYDIAVVGRFTGGEKPDRSTEFAGISQFEIIDVLKAADSHLEKGDLIEHNRYRDSAPEDFVLLLANNEDEVLKWKILDLSPKAYEYVRQAPPTDRPTTERLSFFLNYLEDEDRIIAADAFSEFAVAPYEKIVPLASLMDRKRVREWLANPKEPADRFVRLGLFGLMIGLCGSEEDVRFLEGKILSGGEDESDFKFGISGMTSGYLMLTGAEGFRFIERELLQDQSATLPQIFPVLQALRFMWTYSGDESLRPELINAMRILLNRSDLADHAILDLARWKDWDSLSRITSMYGQEDYNYPAVKRAIFRFLMAAERDRDDSGSPSAVSLKAKKELARLKIEDPKTAKQVQRYLFE